ncbi:MAG: hypothetical protein ACI85I_002305 [Arenicella sp.]|jgi:hypothetical protein
MKVAILGESHSDSDALINLLARKFSLIEFLKMPAKKTATGSMLDNPKVRRAFRVEFEFEKPDLVILSRDLDAIRKSEDYSQKLEERKEYFSKLKRTFNQKTLRLLHIYELEALILADIDSFNKWGDFEVEFVGNPMNQEEPKEYLKLQTKNNFKESDNPEIFKQLDYEKLEQNCQYFADFSIKFKNLIKETN